MPSLIMSTWSSNNVDRVDATGPFFGETFSVEI
jgi:hypothetical protein